MEGRIERFTKEKLVINGKKEWREFLIMGLEKEEIVLGLLWIREYSSEII